MKLRPWVLFLATMFALGCGGPPPPAGLVPAGLVPAGPVGLLPGDAIRVQVWQEEELSGEFLVSPDGAVFLPLIGGRDVTGIPAPELERRIRTEYGEYLENPSVNVTALRRIAIVGEVRQPGLHFVDATVTLSNALALAGGLLPSGNRENIRLTRGGSILVRNLDADLTVGEMPIRSGDQIEVGQHGWFTRNWKVVLGTATTFTVAVLYLLYR